MQRASPSNGSAAPDPSLAETVQQLQEQVKQLRSIVADLRSESEQYRAETRELREELHSARAQSSANKPATVQVAQTAGDSGDQDASQVPKAVPESAPESRLAKLEEQYDLLTGKVDDQYQTKVESRSKYKVRLSGLVLMDLFSNRGRILTGCARPGRSMPTCLVVPAAPASRSVSRKSGWRCRSGTGRREDPRRSAGGFAGGFQYAPNGIALGLFRLRTATMHLDWAKTSIVAGQDAPFFSALSPTSFATLAEPALSYAGNLWMWIPQIRVERRLTISENSNFLLQGGILDGATGEPPVYGYGRTAQAGEYSRQPGYAGRVAS